MCNVCGFHSSLQYCDSNAVIKNRELFLFNCVVQLCLCGVVGDYIFFLLGGNCQKRRSQEEVMWKH